MDSQWLLKIFIINGNSYFEPIKFKKKEKNKKQKKLKSNTMWHIVLMEKARCIHDILI